MAVNTIAAPIEPIITQDRIVPTACPRYLPGHQNIPTAPMSSISTTHCWLVGSKEIFSLSPWAHEPFSGFMGDLIELNILFLSIQLFSSQTDVP